jgi:galactonate dehydratase
MVQVESVDRIPLQLPLTDRAAAYLTHLPHWRYVEVYRVRLSDGSVGYGEQMPFYWGPDPDPSDAETILERPPTAVLWDDSIGVAPRIAVLDALGKHLDVPSRTLVGEDVRPAVPMAWWCNDMPASAMRRETARAVEEGYRTVKIKGRPWFDLEAQVSAVAEELPGDGHVGIDFNETLRTPAEALSVLGSFDDEPSVSLFESPILRTDVEGYQRLQDELETPVAMHYGRPSVRTNLCADMADAFVSTGPPGTVREQSETAAMSGKQTLLQLVGTDLTACWAAEIAAVLPSELVSVVCANHIYDASVLDAPPRVTEGTCSVTDEPGLGITVDEDALEAYRSPIPESRPRSESLLRIDDGETRRHYVADNLRLLWTIWSGDFPPFSADLTGTYLGPDDVEEWDAVYERADRRTASSFEW